jgi:hypothetical protein
MSLEVEAWIRKLRSVVSDRNSKMMNTMKRPLKPRLIFVIALSGLLQFVGALDTDSIPVHWKLLFSGSHVNGG